MEVTPARMARYLALQKQYRVGTFPSVFLTTPEGANLPAGALVASVVMSDHISTALRIAGESGWVVVIDGLGMVQNLGIMVTLLC